MTIFAEEFQHFKNRLIPNDFADVMEIAERETELSAFVNSLVNLALRRGSPSLSHLAARASLEFGKFERITQLANLSSSKEDPAMMTYQGAALVFKNFPEKGIELIKTALRLVKDDPFLEIENLALQCMLFARLRKYDEIGPLFSQAEKILTTNPNVLGIEILFLGCLEGRGYVYLYENKLKKGLIAFNTLYKLAKNHKNKFFETMSLNGLGNYFSQKGDEDKTRDSFQAALKVASSEFPSGWVLSEVSTNLGIISGYRGEIQEAIGYFNQCPAINESMDVGLLSLTATLNFIDVLFDANEFRLVLENLRRILPLVERSNRISDRRIHLEILLKIAQSYQEKLSHDLAIDYLSKGLKLAEERDWNLSEILTHLVNILIDKGDFTTAQKYLERSVSHAKTKTEMAYSIHFMGKLESLRDPKKAHAFYMDSLARGERYDVLKLRLMNLLGLTELAIIEFHEEQTRKSLEEAIVKVVLAIKEVDKPEYSPRKKARLVPIYTNLLFLKARLYLLANFFKSARFELKEIIELADYYGILKARHAAEEFYQEVDRIQKTPKGDRNYGEEVKLTFHLIRQGIKGIRNFREIEF